MGARMLLTPPSLFLFPLPAGGRRCPPAAVFSFFILIMKTFRIRYSIVHGEYEYADEIIVTAKAMNDREAVRRIAGLWLADESPGYREEFGEILLREDFGFLPCGVRAIADVSWEEAEPILVIVDRGIVEDIKNIPADIEIRVIDWDPCTIDRRGRPVPSVSVWTADDEDEDGEYVPGSGSD
jgi:hypothetical protein